MKKKTWVVQAGDGALIDDIVARLGGDARALDDGRVFVGRKRAHRGMAVSVGDEVHVHARDAAPSRQATVTILHRDAGILAVDKPAGISTIPDERDAEGSLLHRAARAAGVDPRTLHPTSRLDRGVSGVVIFAENAAARARLREARSAGWYIRRYVAIASSEPLRGVGSQASLNAPAVDNGLWNARIGRARDPKKREVNGRDATDAFTRYRVVGVAADRDGGLRPPNPREASPRIAALRSAILDPLSHPVLLAVEPVTGRTHQIRLHASHAGAPLLGDRDYGGPRTLVLASGKVLTFGRIALHCAWVKVPGSLDVRAPVPDELRGFWRALGGEDEAWAIASDEALGV